MTTETLLSEVTNSIFLLLGPGSLLCCWWPLFLSLLNYVLILLPLRLVFLLHFFPSAPVSPRLGDNEELNLEQNHAEGA